MKKILVTGSNGQLGQCLKQQLQNTGDVSCYFATREDLDITNNDVELTMYKLRALKMV